MGGPMSGDRPNWHIGVRVGDSGLMSLDFFLQHLPVGIRSVEDIPADYEPGPIGARAAVVDSIRTVFPTFDFSDPEWGRIEGDGFSIEVNLRGEDPVRGFALHVR